MISRQLNIQMAFLSSCHSELDNSSQQNRKGSHVKEPVQLEPLELQCKTSTHTYIHMVLVEVQMLIPTLVVCSATRMEVKALFLAPILQLSAPA